MGKFRNLEQRIKDLLQISVLIFGIAVLFKLIKMAIEAF